MLTPIFIDFTKPSNGIYETNNYLELDAKDPVDLYTEDTDTVSNSKERILAPRYYVLIHSPANNFQATKKIDIQKAPHSIGSNLLRVLLQPSKGYGFNACYRIEFWKWHPLLNSTSNISKEKVHEEYWYVPTINSTGYYVPNYYFYQLPRPWPHTRDEFLYHIYGQRYLPTMYWPYYYNRNVVTSCQADRVIEGDYVIDTMNYRDALSFLSLDGSDTSLITLKQPDLFVYNQEVKDWTFSIDTYGVQLKRLISGVNGLEQAEPVSGQNQTIKVKHYLPFHPCDIVVKESYLQQYIY